MDGIDPTAPISVTALPTTFHPETRALANIRPDPSAGISSALVQAKIPNVITDAEVEVFKEQDVSFASEARARTRRIVLLKPV